MLGLVIYLYRAVAQNHQMLWLVVLLYRVLAQNHHITALMICLYRVLQRNHKITGLVTFLYRTLAWNHQMPGLNCWAHSAGWLWFVGAPNPASSLLAPVRPPPYWLGRKHYLRAVIRTDDLSGGHPYIPESHPSPKNTQQRPTIHDNAWHHDNVW